ncbi:MAG TPA: dihydroorotate dehydrogenase [Candidatus Dormibacteraeota bacterium]|nr:dihydroorotate dehydrogenase [Candidatus Dormibacteraeota bacterium]
MSGPEAPFDARLDLGRGLVLANPISVASGTFGFGFEAEALAGIGHLGAIFSKGTTALARGGNRPPRIAETAAGMLNSIGLQNPGVEVVARDYAPRWATWSVPVLVNVAGADISEYVAVVRRLDGVSGVAGVELNISCPNIAHGLDFATEPGAAARCVAAVRAATELPLVVKLSPNVTDIAEVARAVEDAGADAVSAVNTYVGMKVALLSRRPVLPGHGSGGLSGPAIKPLALAAVVKVRRAVVIPVIGIGGIASATDALEFLVAGADAVQVGTANFNNPQASREIVEGCLAYAQQHQLRRFAELRWQDLDHPGAQEPAGEND